MFRHVQVGSLLVLFANHHKRGSHIETGPIARRTLLLLGDVFPNHGGLRASRPMNPSVCVRGWVGGWVCVCAWVWRAQSVLKRGPLRAHFSGNCPKRFAG